jgi:hypothetical protein
MKIIRQIPSSVDTIVVMQHYPIARAPGDTMSGPDWSLFGWSTLDKWWVSLQNSQWWAYSFLAAKPDTASRLLSSLEELAEQDPNRSVFVVFGHRHRRSLGTIKRVTFVEAPNVGSHMHNGFFFGKRRDDGRVSISWCDRRTDK